MLPRRDCGYVLKSEISGKMRIFVYLLTGTLVLKLTHGNSFFTCEPITIPRCSGMAYNMTFFPNMMDHYDQDTADKHMTVSCSFLSYKFYMFINILLCSE
ncbi:UNVERIFIED_CONTAM: hypothetical protein K2H54_031102 [Gekko kuhli]